MTIRNVILLILMTLTFAACSSQQPVEVTRIVTRTVAEAAEPIEVTRLVEVPVPGETVVQELLVSPRGRGDTLNLLYWQLPDHLNPYLPGATPIDPSALTLEPLARYDEGGNLIPWLATEIPTITNGGISEGFNSITWKLRPDIFWSDGNAFTAADVVFTADYCRVLIPGCVQLARFENVEQIEAIDDHTVTMVFKQPEPNPYQAFVGAASPVLQKIQFEACLTAENDDCGKENKEPIGTGPYVVDDLSKGKTAVFHPNEFFRDPFRPYFSEVIISSNTDATSAASAVLSEGSADFAWNVQVEPHILHQLAQQGKGHVASSFGSCVERLTVNLTNPNPALGGQRSAWAADNPNPHPFLTQTAVRQALSLAIDRPTLVNQIYGDSGDESCNLIPAPAAFVSPNNNDCFNPNLAAANTLLDEAGVVDLNGDGIRESNGIPLQITLLAAINPLQQAVQSQLQTSWAAIGVGTTLQSIPAEELFSSETSEEGNYAQFYADVQLYTDCFAGIDPAAYLNQWTCAEIPSPANEWQGNNVARYCSADYDALASQLGQTNNPLERATLIQQMNDMLVQQGIIIPLAHRGTTSAYTNMLLGVRPNAWDSDLWNIGDWVRTIR